MPPKAVPKEDIEYKFRFRKDNLIRISTLIYEGMNEKGRCVFFNKLSNTYTSMTLKRFAYIHRFNLISEKSIEKRPSAVELERQKARQERLEEIAKERKQKEEIRKYIMQLKALNKTKKELVEKIVQRSIEEIILELNNGHWTSRTAQEWYKIQHIIT